MKKILSIILSILMTVSMFSLCAAAEEDKEPAKTTATVINPPVDLYKVTTSPKIDGVVNPGEYGDKIHTTYEAGKEGEFDYRYNPPKNVDADFYACWDDRALYLAWVVRTDHHKNEKGGQDMWLWNCVQFEVCDRDPRENGLVVLSLGCAPGTGPQAGKQLKQLYTSAGTPYIDTFFKNTMWNSNCKRDDAAKTTTYEVSIPWTTLNTVSNNASRVDDTVGFAALGGKPKEGMTIGLAYSINDTTGEKQINPPDLVEGEKLPEYPADGEPYDGFWADQRHTVQWGSSILGGYDHGEFLADSMMAVATLRGVKGADDDGDDNPGGGTDNPGGGTDNPGGGTDNPSTDTPSTGEPATGEPSTGVPSTGEPQTGAPSTDVPETFNPVTDEPETPDIDEPTDTDPEEESSLVWLWIVIGVVAAAAIAAIVIVLVKKKGGSDGDTPDGPTDGGAPTDTETDGSAADSSENTEASADAGSDDKQE